MVFKLLHGRMQIKNTKNWLLISGGLLLSTSLFIIFLVGLKAPYKDPTYGGFSSKIIDFFILPLIVAPIFEEIAFRGFLVKNKVIHVLFLILSIIISFLAGFSIYLFFILILIYLLYVLNRIYKKNWLLTLLILLSAYQFSIMHYNFDLIFSFRIIPFLLVQFSAGLILSWLIINKSMITAIIFHSSWNLIIISIMLFGLQFVNSNAQYLEFNGYVMEWSRKPIFNSNIASYKSEECKIIVKNMSISELLILFDRKNLGSYTIAEPLVKYNLTFYKLDARSCEMNNLIKALENEQLIFKSDSLNPSYFFSK